MLSVFQRVVVFVSALSISLFAACPAFAVQSGDGTTDVYVMQKSENAVYVADINANMTPMPKTGDDSMIFWMIEGTGVLCLASGLGVLLAGEKDA